MTDLSPARQRVVSVALGEVGTTENPRNSNRTKYGEWYGMNGQPWCAIFVDWCYVRAGLPDLRNVVSPLWAATWAGTSAARVHGWTVPVAQAKPGDIAMFNFPGGDPVDHTGIVTDYPDLTRHLVATVEGNTSAAGSQSNGGQVLTKRRPFSVIAAVIRVPQLDYIPPGDDMPLTQDEIERIARRVTDYLANPAINPGTVIDGGARSAIVQTQAAVSDPQSGIATRVVAIMKKLGL